MKNFSLLYEEVIGAISNSYVDYELFDEWKVRIIQKMKLMNKEEAIQYVRKNIGAYWS